MTSWTARFIAPDQPFDGAPLLRKQFALDTGHGGISDAQLLLSALGIVEATINGAPASDDLFTPGWTSYEWRVRYSITDVTERIQAVTDREVTLGLALGNGWYRGRLGWKPEGHPYGPELAGFAELQITFVDGHIQTIATDDTWTAGPSVTVDNSLYDGQRIDARLHRLGWNAPGFDDSDWDGVHVVQFDLDKLTGYVGPPVRRQLTVAPTRIWSSPTGKVLVDFGQNLVGWVRLRVRGSSGDTISVRHAEVLEHDELGTRPLRTAKATDAFTLSGGDDEFEPTLTFHGFRYVEIDGWPGGIDAVTDHNLEAVVVSSDLHRTGYFECSDPLIDQLHQNIVWAMRGNFLDIPTDCPQRDERLGWTGDIAAFAPTAAFLFDVGDFIRDWLRDVAAEQVHNDGIVPFVVPDVLKFLGQPDEAGVAPVDSTAIWSDAAAWVPWAMWRAYGDVDALSEAYPSMASHARRVRSLLSGSGVWDTGFQFGDWLDPDAPADRPGLAKADQGVVATASAFRTATILRDAAAVVGFEEDSGEFAEMADDLRDAFQREYVTDQRILSDCTTVYSLAIAFGILDQDENRWAGDRLAELVQEAGHHISTGFAGTPFIMDALTQTGHIDTAYTLLLQRENPSWLYPVTMGATTVWERWDSMLPDGSINPGQMTSFNHYALGAVADWLHRTVGGIAPLTPGYSRVLVAPAPGGDLQWAATSLQTQHGVIAARWDRTEAGTAISITIPAGVTAVLRSGQSEEQLPAGIHQRTLPAANALKRGSS